MCFLSLGAHDGRSMLLQSSVICINRMSCTASKRRKNGPIDIAVIFVSLHQTRTKCVSYGKKYSSRLAALETRMSSWLRLYRVGQKKVSLRSLHITSSNTGRFSKFFQCHILQEIFNKVIIKYATSPQACRYTTL